MACKHWQEGPRDEPPAAFSSDGLVTGQLVREGGTAEGQRIQVPGPRCTTGDVLPGLRLPYLPAGAPLLVSPCVLYGPLLPLLERPMAMAYELDCHLNTGNVLGSLMGLCESTASCVRR